MEFERMGLRLLNVYDNTGAQLFFSEIVSMSRKEKRQLDALRSSAVSGEVECVDEDKSVTVLRLQTVAGPPLGERVLCYLKAQGRVERYLLFSRYAALIMNGGNFQSRVSELASIDTLDHPSIPAGPVLNNSAMLHSMDDERMLVISSQEIGMPLAADLMLQGYTVRQERSLDSAPQPGRPQYQLQPTEILVTTTPTVSEGLDALGHFLPYVGIWTWHNLYWPEVSKVQCQPTR